MILPRASPLLPAIASGLVGLSIIGGAFGLHQLLWERAYERTSTTEGHFLNRDGFILEARVRSRVNDLYLLKGIAEDSLKESPDVQLAIKAMRPAAEKLLLSRNVYDEARLLDPTGKEIFRLDFDAGSHPAVVEVPSEKWRDRSDRQYYKEARQLAAESAGFSPFDFEVEHGGETQPKKPVVRASAQIRDASGALAAILVLNMDGQSIVTPRQYTPKQERSALVLNTEGFWLVGPREENAWAFLNPERANESLKISNKDLWAKLTAKSDGSFFDGQALYCFRAINPASPALDYPPLSMPLVHPERLQWILMKKFPTDEVWAEFGTARKTLWGCTILALLFAMPATWIGVRAFRQRDLMRRQLNKLVQSYLHGVAVLETSYDARGKISDFRIVLVNEAANEAFGQLITKKLGASLLQHEPDLRRNGVFDTFCQIVEDGVTRSFEQKYRRKGEDRWLLLNAAKFANGLIVNMVDISDRRASEEKLRQSEIQLQMASRMAKLGAWRIEYPEQKVVWSSEVYAIYEVADDFQLTVESAMSYYSEESQIRLAAGLQKCAKAGVPMDEEFPFTTAKGRQIWVRVIAEAIFVEDTLRIIYGVIEDITQTKEALVHEQELSNAAKAAERAKANFLAVMSHEIRTPMNGILGFADILALRPLEAEDKESVRIIRDSGQTLLRVLDDILDYSRIESGRLQIEDRQGSPVQLVEQTRQLLTSIIQHRSVSLRTEVAADLPIEVFFDPDRTRQILVNLAGNALKFTQQGNVTIGVRLAGGFPEPKIGIEFYVRDTGIGIAPDKLAHIFEPFTQADNSISRRYGGTGLGLAISRSLARLMGGELTAQSTLGQGSTFSLIVPVEIAHPEADDFIEVEDIKFDATFALAHPLKILVAEDDTINLKLINRLLQKLGYEPLSARNGLDTVAVCQAELPDCILMDIHMPELDGQGATREIRAWEKVTPLLHRIFISALTADVLPDDRARTMEAGADDYLTKPINIAALAQTLRRAALEKKSG